MSNQILELAAILQDDEKVRSFGSKVLKEAIARAARAKAGVRPEEYMVRRQVAAGERVPKDLVNLVQVDRNGDAVAGWCEDWTDFFIWKDMWADDQCMPQALGLDPRRIGIADLMAETRLNAEEINVLRDLNIEIQPR